MDFAGKFLKLWSFKLGFSSNSLPLADEESVFPQGGEDDISAHRRLAGPHTKFLLSPISRIPSLGYDLGLEN